MRITKPLGRLIAVILLVLLVIAGLFFLFWLNKPKEAISKAAAAQQKTVAVATSKDADKKDEVNNDLKSALQAFKKKVDAEPNKIHLEEGESGRFVVFDEKEMTDEFGKFFPNGQNTVSSLPEDSTHQQVESWKLWFARHGTGQLKGYLFQHGITGPSGTLTEFRDNKIFLNQEAISAYSALELASLKTKNDFVATINQPVNGTSMGIDGKGGVVADLVVRNYNGWVALFEQNPKTGQWYITLLYCLNPVFPEGSVPNVPKKDLRIPQTPPKEKTPPPTTQVVPKKADEAPPMPQGGGKIDGSDNPPTSWVEPPAQYIAPEAPKPSEQTTQPSAPQGNQGGSGAVTPPSNWQGSGGFDNPNGRTTVGSNGSVQTPGGVNRPGLTGQNTVVPPVQNGGTTNQGVNNGNKNADEIPMDD